jgi:hypothetical protein
LTVEKASHEGVGAASLYLRLGALCKSCDETGESLSPGFSVFGTVGIVLFGLEIFLCANQQMCNRGQIVKHAMSAGFIFLQMHFIFANAKVIEYR